MDATGAPDAPWVGARDLLVGRPEPQAQGAHGYLGPGRRGGRRRRHGARNGRPPAVTSANANHPGDVLLVPGYGGSTTALDQLTAGAPGGPPAWARRVEQRQVHPARQVRVGGGLLDQRADLRQYLAHVPGDPLAHHLDLTAGGVDQAEQHADQRGLTRPVRPEQASTPRLLSAPARLLAAVTVKPVGSGGHMTHFAQAPNNVTITARSRGTGSVAGKSVRALSSGDLVAV